MQIFRANLRRARFLAASAYHAVIRLRDGQRLSPGLYLERRATQSPESTALRYEDRALTFSALDEAANRHAHALTALGATKGDVVALLMDNRPEFLVAVLGANKIGVCTSLLNSHVAGEQLVHALTICSPKFILVGSEHVASLREVADRLPVPREHVLVWSEGDVRATFEGSVDWNSATAEARTERPASTAEQGMNDPFVFIYTSGTTGLPKAAPMKNGRFLRGAAVFGHAVMRLRPGDVLFNPGLPLYHSTGLVMGFGTVLSTGATLALRRKFSASQFWDDVAAFGATGFTYIGELCRYLLNTNPHPLEKSHRLRFAIGAGLRPDIWERFQERFGIPTIVEFYGATEGNIGIVNIDGVPGMMGRLMPGQVIVHADPHTGEITRDARSRCTSAKVGESGILLGQINARASFDGYVDRSRNEAKIVRNAFGDGKDYFNTGDLVQLHPHGYVAFKDRMGDTFRWKGENVSTSEVAEILNRCLGVSESNVYGVQVPGADGRAGMAALVTQDGFDLERFRAHVDEHLPAYARPIFVRLQEAIQVTATFKQVKTHLRDEGYDLYKIDRDRVYVYDSTVKSYVELTPERQTSIDSGAFGL